MTFRCDQPKFINLLETEVSSSDRHVNELVQVYVCGQEHDYIIQSCQTKIQNSGNRIINLNLIKTLDAS